MNDLSRPRSTLEWLECSRCRAAYDVTRLHGLCVKCDGVLLARYRLDEATRKLTPEVLRDRPPTIWRYGEVLPGSCDALTLGEGMTPFREASFLGRTLGLERLYLKDEAVNPTGSFKARGMATAVTMARQLGARRIAVPSAGNAGGAAAAYGALAGLAVDVFLPHESPEPFRLEALAYGASVHRIEGDITDCGVRVREDAEREGWFDLSTMREPYRLEGKKTLAYELAEQMEWELPDVIVYPTGGGTGLVGIWKAIEEMEQIGLLRRKKRPRMVAVQAAGCAPIVRAFREELGKSDRWPNPKTYACGLCVPAAIGDSLILQLLRESAGTAVAVTEEEMAAGQLEFARGEGVFASPEGAATLAAAHKLVEGQWIRHHESVVLFNTGTGLKYPGIPGVRVP